jgi:hypothetical protein
MQRNALKLLLFLTMTQQLLDLPGIFSPEAFSKLYGKASYWIAFRMNPGEEELRRSEKTFLLSLLNRANDDEAPALFDVLKPWDHWAFTMEDSGTARLKKELCRECLEILTPKAERALITYLNRSDVFRAFSSGKASQTFQYLLFHQDHLPWSGAIRSAMQAVVKDAKRGLPVLQTPFSKKISNTPDVPLVGLQPKRPVDVTHTKACVESPERERR